MSPFEYVMVLVSIIVGLALTHVLAAFSSAVHRIRGHGEPLRLEPVYLLWVGFVVTWLVSFWWWEYKFHDLGVEWTFGLYLFVITYAVALFLLAAILVPHRMQGVHDSYDYFMAGRGWFFGAFIVVNTLDVPDTFFKGVEWGLRPVFWFQICLFYTAAVVGIATRRRPLQLASAAAAFGVQLWFMFRELGILGSF